MESEKETGYIPFSVNMGAESNGMVQRYATMDPFCSITTQTVMGLLDVGNLLDINRRVLSDNWFNSVEQHQGHIGGSWVGQEGITLSGYLV